MAISLGKVLYLKEGLLALSLLATAPAIYGQLAGAESLNEQVGYLTRLAILWSALFAAAYIRPAPLRWAIALFFSLSAYLMGVYEQATTQFLTYDAFITMLHSMDADGDALVQNQTAFISAVGPMLLLLVAMGLPARRGSPSLPTGVAVAAPWLGVAALAGIVFVGGGDGAAGQPPSFTPIAYLTLAGYEAMSGDIGEREPVRLQRASPPRSRNIVLVVDESVAGQYLDINSATGVPTPLLRTWPGAEIHNYGLAIAATNCSVSSNVTLRYGGTRADYRRIIATQPSIWAYAHKAGLRTVYIDGQGKHGQLLNYMTKEERAEIDSFVQFDNVGVNQSDMAVAEVLIRELADPRPKFIMINKDGAHFPIHEHYPEAYLRYRPALARGDHVFAGVQPGFKGTPEEWTLYRNSYRNTLLWVVGAFFDKVLREGDFASTTMIYTSDHGQNLHEDGSHGLYTHCSPNPRPSEGVVPLVIMGGPSASNMDWRSNLSHNRNRSSHYMIFPTLLKLMGYEPAAVEANYGRSLEAPSTDPGTFNILFNARLHREPRWLPVELAQISRPLTSDISNTDAELPQVKIAGRR